ncbi:hypothetical protein HRbin22_02323 [Candidatus Thermoflexus japonica]|uniref:Uncharacterized protein n=1 Tax=Candidatus Thermoflexus japonica TaxID=2035417 RepID=A0A2H5Y9F5_9CHLR|nr:hypothetical protein HRbin22_02323 [Candidatus Thermoflexus japonica]
MRLREWMEALPKRLRPLLPPDLSGFRWSARPWLVQIYDRDPAFHYEVWHLGERRGRIEIGLHFESRDPERNRDALERAKEECGARRSAVPRHRTPATPATRFRRWTRKAWGVSLSAWHSGSRHWSRSSPASGRVSGSKSCER